MNWNCDKILVIFLYEKISVKSVKEFTNKNIAISKFYVLFGWRPVISRAPLG